MKETGPVTLCGLRCVSDRLHVWQGHLLRRHGLQECQLLLHLSQQPCGTAAAMRSGTRQHVSISYCMHSLDMPLPYTRIDFLEGCMNV